MNPISKGVINLASNKATALAVEKCFVCELPTNNKPYLGQILCDECIEELDNSIDQAIDRQEPAFNDLAY